MPAAALDEVWTSPTQEVPITSARQMSIVESPQLTSSVDPIASSRPDSPPESPRADLTHIEHMLMTHLAMIRAENERRFHICVGGACIITVMLLLYMDRLQMQLQHR